MAQSLSGKLVVVGLLLAFLAAFVSLAALTHWHMLMIPLIPVLMVLILLVLPATLFSLAFLVAGKLRVLLFVVAFLLAAAEVFLAIIDFKSSIRVVPFSEFLLLLNTLALLNGMIFVWCMRHGEARSATAPVASDLLVWSVTSGALSAVLVNVATYLKFPGYRFESGVFGTQFLGSLLYVSGDDQAKFTISAVYFFYGFLFGAAFGLLTNLRSRQSRAAGAPWER